MSGRKKQRGISNQSPGCTGSTPAFNKALSPNPAEQPNLPTILPATEAERAFFRFFLTALHNSVKESHYAAQRGNMQMMQDLWQGVDALVREAAARFGVSIPAPPKRTEVPLAARAIRAELLAQARLEPENAVARPTAQANPLPFQAGQYWVAPDGQIDFRVRGTAETRVRIQWCVEGRLERYAELEGDDLLQYVRSQKLQCG
jgi:hypothetical protein